MSALPITGMTQEEQHRLMEQLHSFLGKQIKSYHKHRHMGDNSSVPVELAQELMTSVEYTLDLAGGIFSGQSIEQAFLLGQELLTASVDKARTMLDLVIATAPPWQTECRWNALSCMERYLADYDSLHLAHRMPDELFYPICTAVPECLRGIDNCLLYLNVMWIENQIMAGAEDVAEPLWEVVAQGAHGISMNQCEQLLTNGIGKAMLYTTLNGLVFDEPERERINSMLRGKTSGEVRKILSNAALLLCKWLELSDEIAKAYVCSAAEQLMPRLEGALPHDNLEAVFL